MNNRENIYSLEGFSKVFKFTVRQTFKNKGYLLSFVIFVLVMTLMGPLQYLGQSAGQGAAEDSMNFNSADVDVDNIYIYDQLGVIQSSDNVKDLYESRGKDDSCSFQTSAGNLPGPLSHLPQGIPSAPVSAPAPLCLSCRTVPHRALPERRDHCKASDTPLCSCPARTCFHSAVRTVFGGGL